MNETLASAAAPTAPAPSAPAPAAPAAPSTVSATMDAANRSSFADFDKAHLAAKQGKPLAEVAAPTETPAPTTPETPAQVEARQLSKRQRDINDGAKRAVESATAQLREENARLKAQLDGRPAPAQTARPDAAASAQPTVPEYKRIASLPGAPKLNDVDAQGNALYETVEEHSAAMHLFVQQALQREATAHTTDKELADAQRARVDTFIERLEAAKTADPEFVNKLTPEVKALKPVSGLAPGEASGPLNVLWELVYDSPNLDKLLLHFSANPTALRAFEQMPEAVQKLPAHMRTSAHIRRIVQQFGALDASFESSDAPATDAPAPPPSTISAAPPPPPTLSRAGTSTDPKAAALKRGDFATFDKLEMAAKRAKRTA